MEDRIVVSYLPDPESHPLWDGIKELLKPALLDGAEVLEPGELVWIAFDGPTLFGAGTTALYDDEAVILACGGFRHKEWVKQAEGVVSAWARDCGAKKLTMRGRKGWARYFAGWDCSLDDDGRWIFAKDLV